MCIKESSASSDLDDYLSVRLQSFLQAEIGLSGARDSGQWNREKGHLRIFVQLLLSQEVRQMTE